MLFSNHKANARKNDQEHNIPATPLLLIWH